MKKTILIGVLILSTAWASFANGGNKPGRKITSSFNKSFSGAKEVTWQKDQDYVVATFHLRGQVMTAYYTKDAMLTAVVHNLLSDQLPACLLSHLKNNLSTYWITSLYEEEKDGSSHYYVTLENADEVVILKSMDSAHWTVENKGEKIFI